MRVANPVLLIQLIVPARPVAEGGAEETEHFVRDPQLLCPVRCLGSLMGPYLMWCTAPAPGIDVP